MSKASHFYSHKHVCIHVACPAQNWFVYAWHQKWHPGLMNNVSYHVFAFVACPAQNPLIYAGRHRLHPNLVNNVTTPCGQRVFILRLPPRYSNTKSKFPFGPGKGRIWIRRGRCKETEPPQSDCPSTPDDNEGSCSAGKYFQVYRSNFFVAIMVQFFPAKISPKPVSPSVLTSHT